MQKGLRWIGRIIGGIVALLLLALGFAYLRSNQILNKTYTPPEDTMPIPTDAASIAKGQYLATTISTCVDCHGQNFGGGIVVDDPALGRITAPNLTTGAGGVGNDLSDADFVRAIRYGVRPNGRSVRVMPSDDYTHLNNTDLGAMIAYIRSLPPIDSSDLPETTLRPLGRVLLAAGQLDILIAERIDFAQTRPDVPVGVTVEYGHYLAKIAGCTGCHGPGLSGGAILGAPPDWPLAANLTPSGQVGGWTEAEFIQTLRTGVDPAGKQLDEEMPWRSYRNMSDAELQAVWLFIQSVPAKEAGTR